MTFVVKEDVLFHPSEVRLFVSQAVVSDGDDLSSLVKKLRHVEEAPISR
jgi:hypothetical protein